VCMLGNQTDLSKLSVLAVVAHWSHSVNPHMNAQSISENSFIPPKGFYNHTNFERYVKDAHERFAVLRAMLYELNALPVSKYIILVTNAMVSGLDGLISEQVVVDRPRCHSRFSHPWCLPWESIRTWAARALAWESIHTVPSESIHTFTLPWETVHTLCGPTFPKQGAHICALSKTFNFYIFTEDDIKIPLSTLSFFSRYADSLHREGYVLVPYDVKKRKTTKTRVRRIFSAATNKTFISVPANTHDFYSRVLLMSRKQFTDYLDGSAWDWKGSHYPDKFWAMREGATLAHLWDPRYSTRMLSHLSLPVLHASAWFKSLSISQTALDI